MESAGKIRSVVATAAAAAALALPVAVARAEVASSGAPVPGASLEAPASDGEANSEAQGEGKAEGGSGAGPGTEAAPDPGRGEAQEPIRRGATLVPPPATASPPPNGGLDSGAGEGSAKSGEGKEDGEGADEGGEAETGGSEAGIQIPDPTAPAIPSLPASSCAASGVPPLLVPIYQRASAKYGLGPQGPAVLAGINAVETGFGQNLGPSSAGAVGWMQFLPSSWEMYGVDADGNGVADPNNPEDAIFAAASYLGVAGMPSDTYGAIFAYNHADWYVEEVLANAGCYAGEVGSAAFTGTGLGPRIPVFRCDPAPDWKKRVPDEYLEAFEAAAARYELGKRGVWALAAIARLESDFGRGMSKRQLRGEGPLGLDKTEWAKYAVDGDEDGKVTHASPADSGATLARLIWSRGSIQAGVFFHNQAEWYVREVMQQAGAIEGGCRVSYVDWRVAPLSTGFETPGEKAVVLDGLASAPRGAPVAVKAAIEAANSIATTPYVWGGGHGSWYSYGYDCSGAVSFALYGAGLLDTPLTSGALESYGEPGPGKWITIYANATHTYAVIAGLRWDTVGDASGTGPRWHPEPPYPEGFVVRHPPGY